ncbi:MAG: helix-turn-helix domain-containing protein [Anaerolineae bacterium]|nr:helix-turn-helix domain-containing protein [Anaerolineae bacterium]
MDQALQDARDSMIEGLGQLTDFFGFNPVMGRLYGALLMSPEPLSLDELEAIVAKSKASVSMYMQSLERWGMVRQVWVKGDRRKFYSAEGDLWKIITYILESRERREVGVALKVMAENTSALEKAKKHLDENECALADHYLVQIRNLQSFFQFAQLVLEMLLARSDPPTPDDLAASNMDK